MNFAPKVGERVRVRETLGVVHWMHGKIGTVESFRDSRIDGPLVVVRFDPPVPHIAPYWSAIGSLGLSCNDIEPASAEGGAS